MSVCRETTGKLRVISAEAVIDAVKRYIYASWGGDDRIFEQACLTSVPQKGVHFITHYPPTVDAPGSTPQLNEGWIKKLI